MKDERQRDISRLIKNDERIVLPSHAAISFCCNLF